MSSKEIRCQRCGDIFEGSGSTEFCASCRNVLYSMRARKNHICKICGTEFIGGAKALYCAECSRKKRNDYQREFMREYRAKQKENPQTKPVLCEYCGKEFTVPIMSSIKVCGDCRHEHRHIEREYICTDCGKPFTTIAMYAFRCPTCRRERANRQKAKRGRDQRYSDKLPPLPRIKKQKPSSLAEIAKKAAEMGLTYGEYVAKYGGN